MTLYTSRGESCVVGFEENDANYVVADVTFPLKLLRVVFFVWQQCADVEHYFYTSPVRIDGIETYESKKRYLFCSSVTFLKR